MAVALLTELELDDGVAGGLGTAALICGFIAFDAPARVRVRWQLCCAPVVGICAALGVLSSASALLAVAAMAVVATVCGYFVAVSMRLMIAGLTFVLALLIAQGLFLDTSEADRALALGTCGGLMQVATAAIAWLFWDRESEPFRFGPAVRGAVAALRGSLSLHSTPMRHAIRFGGALAIGVAIYRLAGFDNHGYWVPLTILFVLKPEENQTAERIAMRAAGTVLGLILATGLAELMGDDVVPVTIVLTAAAAFAYALLAIEYALFTTAITVYVVLLTDTLGSSAFDAAGERGLGTVLGIAVAGLAFRAFGEIDEERTARGVM
ncbi:MAG: hypothetical protein QOI10_1304 [Solirubrobacterales bacterium]|nr:hypothetical protein [Solirubrobacterales bacterium]